MPPLDAKWLLVGFVVLWLLMSGLVSWLSGWYGLSRRFHNADAVDGERFSFRSAAIGWRWFPISYGNCLFATIGSKGLALSILFPFRFLHPPLLIPWSAIDRCEEVKFWLRRPVAVNVAGFNRRLLFGGSLGRRIFEEWSQARGRL